MQGYPVSHLVSTRYIVVSCFGGGAYGSRAQVGGGSVATVREWAPMVYVSVWLALSSHLVESLVPMLRNLGSVCCTGRLAWHEHQTWHIKTCVMSCGVIWIYGTAA